ncbi:hypothetical protein PIB30_004457 [Stylosanthes scabra]|uniref:Uncharacterized protein n=1 Tax=Stylosanthes scabra TaxID=79078 RepID=A0ABU6W1R9_9FABA|nr:hypothetical protein [Stylosanthes scabra]
MGPGWHTHPTRIRTRNTNHPVEGYVFLWILSQRLYWETSTAACCFFGVHCYYIDTSPVILCPSVSPPSFCHRYFVYPNKAPESVADLHRRPSHGRSSSAVVDLLRCYAAPSAMIILHRRICCCDREAAPPLARLRLHLLHRRGALSVSLVSVATSGVADDCRDTTPGWLYTVRFHRLPGSIAAEPLLAFPCRLLLSSLLRISATAGGGIVVQFDLKLLDAASSKSNFNNGGASHIVSSKSHRCLV